MAVDQSDLTDTGTFDWNSPQVVGDNREYARQLILEPLLHEWAGLDGGFGDEETKNEGVLVESWWKPTSPRKKSVPIVLIILSLSLSTYIYHPVHLLKNTPPLIRKPRSHFF